MKKLSYKIVGVLFGITVLLLIGIFNISYATEEVNMEEIKTVINDKMKEMNLESVIEQPQLGERYVRISNRCCNCKKRN